MRKCEKLKGPAYEHTDERPMIKRPVLVHSDRFHADEVMAVAILKELNLLECEGSGDPVITRTRDRDTIETHHGKAYILDVGGVDDPANLRFDHHQRGFERYYNETAREAGVKMSSCGLLYDFLGATVIRRYIELREDNDDNLDILAFRESVAWCRENDVLTEEKIVEWCDRFYNVYILEIDANDNGVSNLKDNVVAGDVMRYTNSWNLPAIVGRMNTRDTSGAEKQLTAFRMAVDTCANLFHRAMFNFLMDRMDYEQSAWKMRDILDETHESSYGRYEVVTHENHYQYGVLILYEHFNYESAARDLLYNRAEPLWLFTILPKDVGGNDKENDLWRIHTVGVTGMRFVQRAKIIPGDRAKAAVGDAFGFVHNNQFVGDMKGFEAAYTIVGLSVREYHDNTKLDRVYDRLCDRLELGLAALQLSVSIAGLVSTVIILSRRFRS